MCLARYPFREMGNGDIVYVREKAKEDIFVSPRVCGPNGHMGSSPTKKRISVQEPQLPELRIGQISDNFFLSIPQKLLSLVLPSTVTDKAKVQSFSCKRSPAQTEAEILSSE